MGGASERPVGQPGPLHLRSATESVKVFADTLNRVAIANPTDSWRSAALQARASLGDVHLVTTQEVLAEFLGALSGGGSHVRLRASEIVRAILRNARTTVVPQTDDSFRDGLALYEQRIDKRYSLTDCISMNVIRTEGIVEVLTNDHHFSQEGFRILIHR